VEVEREVQVEVEVEVFRCTSETISRCTSETFLRCTSEAHALVGGLCWLNHHFPVAIAIYLPRLVVPQFVS